jgi:hypothetical protein
MTYVIAFLSLCDDRWWYLGFFRFIETPGANTYSNQILRNGNWNDMRRRRHRRYCAGFARLGRDCARDPAALSKAPPTNCGKNIVAACGLCFSFGPLVPAAWRCSPQSAAPRLVRILAAGRRPVSNPFSLLLRFPILRFAADSDLFELANDFGSLS